MKKIFIKSFLFSKYSSFFKWVLFIILCLPAVLFIGECIQPGLHKGTDNTHTEPSFFSTELSFSSTARVPNRFGPGFPLLISHPVDIPGHKSSPSDITSGLAAWWRFKEGIGNILYDSSGNNYHGSIYGPVWTPYKKKKNSLSFDGQDDYVQVHWDAPVQGEKQSFTIICSVNTGESKSNQWIMGDDSGYFHFVFGLKNGNPCIHWRYGESYMNYELVAKKNNVKNKETHIAAVYDAHRKKVSIYIDGKIAASDTRGNPEGIQDFDALFMGRGHNQSPENPEYFKGFIHEILVYRRVLNAKEITALHKGKKPSVDTRTPGTPEGVTGEQISSNRISLSWTAPKDKDVTYYKIYRDNEVIGISLKPHFMDIHFLPGTTYKYTVKAYNSAWNESPYSKTFSLTSLPDTIPPAGYFYTGKTTGNQVIIHSVMFDEGSGMNQGACMKFSNDGKTWSAEMPFTGEVKWKTKTGTGKKIIYGQYCDSAGNWSKVMTYTLEEKLEEDFVIIKNAPDAAHLKWKARPGIREYVILRSTTLGWKGSVQLLQNVTRGDTVLTVESTRGLASGDEIHINKSREDYYIAEIIDKTRIKLTHPVQMNYPAGWTVDLSGCWVKDTTHYKEVARISGKYEYIDRGLEYEKDYYYIIGYSNNLKVLSYSNPVNIKLTGYNMLYNAASGSNGGYAWKVTQHFGDTPELIDGNPLSSSIRIQYNNPEITRPAANSTPRPPDTIWLGFHRINLNDTLNIKRVEISQNMNPDYIQASVIKLGFDDKTMLEFDLKYDPSIVRTEDKDYRMYTIPVNKETSYVNIYVEKITNSTGLYTLWNTIGVYTDEVIKDPVTSALDLTHVNMSVDFSQPGGTLPVLFGTDEIYNNIDGLEFGYMLNTWPYTKRIFNLYRIQAGDFWPRAYGWDLIPIGRLASSISQTNTILSIKNIDSYLNHLSPGQRVKINNELMKVSRVQGNKITVTRGFEWTQLTPHTSNTPVYAYKNAGQILRLQEILPEFKVKKYTDAYVSGINPISSEHRPDNPKYVDLNSPLRTATIHIKVKKGTYVPGDVIRIGREMFLIKAVDDTDPGQILLTVQRGYDGTNARFYQHNQPVGDIYKIIDYEPYYKGFKNDPGKAHNYFWDNFKTTLDKTIKEGNAVPWIIAYSPFYTTQARGKIARIETIKNPRNISNNVIVDEYNSNHKDAHWWYLIFPENDEHNDLKIRGNMYEFYHAELHMLTGKAAGKVYYIRSHSGDKLRVVRAYSDSSWGTENPHYVDLVKEGIRVGDVYKITHPSNRYGNVTPRYWQYNADLFYNVVKFIRGNYAVELGDRPLFLEYYLEPNLGSYGTWTKDAYINSYNIFSRTIRQGGPHFSKGFGKDKVLIGAGSIAGGLNPAIKMSGCRGDYDLALSLVDRSPVLDFISHHRYYMGSRIQKREISWEYWMLRNYARSKGKHIMIIDSEDSVATAGGTGREEARHWARFSVPYWSANFINSYYGEYGESGRLDFIIHFRLYYANDKGLGFAAADEEGRPVLDLVYWPLKMYMDNTSQNRHAPDTVVKVIKGWDNYGWVQLMGTIHGETGEKKVHVVNKKGDQISIQLDIKGLDVSSGFMDSIIGGGKNQTITDGYHPVDYQGKNGKGVIVRKSITDFHAIVLEPYSSNIITLIENR